MDHRTSIDLVICTHNNSALLDRTLAAISKQRVSPDVDWQVTVVNNNCTDETPEVVGKHSRSSKVPLRMIFEPRQGLTLTRVCGARNSSAEWIAFVDDDCLLAEDWVEQAARFALEHPQCGAFGGHIILLFEKTPPSYALSRPYLYAGAYHGETAKRRKWVAGAGMVVRRAALQDSGWLDKQFLEDRLGKRLVSGGDMEMSMRIAARHEVWYNPLCKLRHLITGRRMTRQYVRSMIYGLGASRHNTTALTWSGSYPTWLFYSSLYSIGFLGMGTMQMLREFVRGRSGFDVLIALNPARGWWAAMWSMLRMDAGERRQLLGCAATRNPKT